MQRKIFSRLRWMAVGTVIMGTQFLNEPGFAQPRTTLVPSFSITEEVNDNVFFTSKNREEDVVTRFQAGLELSSKTRQTDITASYQPGLEVLARHPKDSEQFHGFSFNLVHRYSPKLELSFSDGFSLRPTTVPVPTIRLAEIEISRTIEITNSFLARAGYQLTPSTAADFSLGYGLTRFQAARLTDSDAFSLTSGISHQLTRKTRVNGSLRFLFLSAEGGPDTRAFSFSLGTSHEYSPTLAFFTNLGANFSFEDGRQSVGLLTSAGLTKAFRNSALTFSYGRDLTTGTGLQGAATAQRGSIAFNHQLTRQVNWDVALTFSSSKPQVRDGGEVKAGIASAGLNYTISRYVSLRAFYSFTRQETAGATTTRVTNNRGGVILQVTLPSLM